MSETSEHLKLPYIMPSQAQKHVTHNEALRMLDAIVQLSIEGIGATEPPTAPEAGERHIIGSPATGEWTGRENQVAAFVDGAWIYFTPQVGWLAWHRQGASLLAFGGTHWQSVGGSSDQPAFLGINGTATPDERLVVQTSSALFNHDGDDHRLKLNKAASSDTVSLLFQSGFEGRAEFGLPGGEEFTVKVSDDGVQWHDALKIEPSTGEVEFPAGGVTQDGSLFPNLLPDSGRFTDSASQHLLTDATGVLPAYISPFNGASLSLPFQFLHNNDTYGGNRGALDPVVNSLVTTIFGVDGQRHGPEYHVMQINAGTGTTSPLTIDGVTYYRQTMMGGNPRPARFTSAMFVRAQSGEIALRKPNGAVRHVLRNGVPVAFSSSGVVVKPEDGWVYFEMQVTRAALAYDFSDLALNMKHGGVGYMALPRVVAGWVSIGQSIAVLPNSHVFQA